MDGEPQKVHGGNTNKWRREALKSNTFRIRGIEAFLTWVTCGEKAGEDTTSPALFLERHEYNTQNNDKYPEHFSKRDACT